MTGNTLRAAMLAASGCALATIFAPSTVRAELCGSAAAEGAFALERMWPMSCAVEVPTNAPIVVDGAAGLFRSAPADTKLSLSVRRVENGVEVGEPIAGELSGIGDGSAARFFPASALAPNQAYRATAVRSDATGKELERLAHDFTTGAVEVPAIALEKVDVTSYSVELASPACSYDACGAKNCEPAPEAALPHERISVHVPPIAGGLPEVQGDAYARPYEVVVLVKGSEGEILASSRHTQLPGEHGGTLVDVRRRDTAFQACVEVTVSDDADSSLDLPAHCLEVPAALDSVVAEPLGTSTDAIGAAPYEGDTGESTGCNLSGGSPTAPLWAAGLFMLFALRRRMS